MCEVWRQRAHSTVKVPRSSSGLPDVSDQAVGLGTGARVKGPLAHRQRRRRPARSPPPASPAEGTQKRARLPRGSAPCRSAKRPRCSGGLHGVVDARRERPVRHGSRRRRRMLQHRTGRARAPRRSAPTSGPAAGTAADRSAPRPRTAPAGSGSCGVEHGGDHAEHPELLVGELAHVLDRLEQLADAAVAERLALQRHDDGLRRRQPVDREHAERRRAVDEDRVVVVEHRSSACASTCSRPVRLSRCTSAPARSMVAGTRTRPRHPGHGLDDVGQPGPADEDVVQRRVELVGIEAERVGQAGLRVEVHHEHATSLLRPGRRPATARWSSWPRRPSGWRRR